MNSSLFCSENSLFILKSWVKARAFCVHLEFDFEYCKSNIYADQVIKLFVFENIWRLSETVHFTIRFEIKNDSFLEVSFNNWLVISWTTFNFFHTFKTR